MRDGVRLEAQRAAVELADRLPRHQRRLLLVPGEARAAVRDAGRDEDRRREPEALEHGQRVVGDVLVAVVEAQADEPVAWSRRRARVRPRSRRPRGSPSAREPLPSARRTSPASNRARPVRRDAVVEEDADALAAVRHDAAASAPSARSSPPPSPGRASAGRAQAVPPTRANPIRTRWSARSTSRIAGVESQRMAEDAARGGAVPGVEQHGAVEVLGLQDARLALRGGREQRELLVRARDELRLRDQRRGRDRVEPACQAERGRVAVMKRVVDEMLREPGRREDEHADQHGHDVPRRATPPDEAPRVPPPPGRCRRARRAARRVPGTSTSSRRPFARATRRTRRALRSP